MNTDLYACSDLDTPAHRLRVNRVVLNVTIALRIPCRNCESADHITPDCPELRALLFAPTRYLCDDCGAPINHDGVCPACEEVAAVDRLLVTGMVRDAFGISLELRAACRKDALAIDRVCGF